MTMMAGLDLPLPAIREHIIGALNIVVQQDRLMDNTRRMVAISEIQGVKDGKIALEDVFTFTQTGITPAGRVTGYFSATGFVPKCIQRMKAFGIEVPLDIFDKERRTPV
jgi:pilus assembly protein CpaF